jgi:sRNA-binding regulator protein Hfq
MKINDSNKPLDKKAVQDKSAVQSVESIVEQPLENQVVGDTPEMKSAESILNRQDADDTPKTESVESVAESAAEPHDMENAESADKSASDKQTGREFGETKHARTIYDAALVKNDPSNKYLFKQFKQKEEVIFVCYTKKVKGVIEQLKRYHMYIVGRKKLLEKAFIVYCYKPDAAKAVEQLVQIDLDVVEEKLPIARAKAYRLEVPDDLIKKCFEEKRKVAITMRNGHVLKGTIFSYGIFSIRLQLDSKTRVVLFRHAIYDFEYRKS